MRFAVQMWRVWMPCLEVCNQDRQPVGSCMGGVGGVFYTCYLSWLA